MTRQSANDAQRPTATLARQQSEWLAPARSRLLRHATIGRRRRVLEIGAGNGVVAEELARRCGGICVALDRARPAPPTSETAPENLVWTLGRGEELPFSDRSFDLVFFQLALLWMPARRVLREAVRVLAPGGAIVAIEPDYGGMIEHPTEVAVQSLWLAGLERAGADPAVGRRLAGWMTGLGLTVRVDLLPQLISPSPARFDLLAGLPLTPEEQGRLRAARAADRSLAHSGETVVAHLPFFLVAGTRCDL